MVFKYGLLILVVTVTVGWVAAGSSAGEGCILTDPENNNTEEYATCIRFGECTYAKGISCRGHLPQMCSSDPEDDSVCCRSDVCPPLPTSMVKVPLTGYKAWDYCVNLAELTHPCVEGGDSQKRSSICPVRKDSENGAEVVVGDYPHLVLLSEVDDPWTSVSLGTLVSENWVLTSGSIAFKKLVLFAKIGGLAGGIGGTTYDIISHEYPDAFVEGQLFNDIGLLQLNKNVVFTKNILPACLHTGNPLPKETLKDIITVVGVISSVDVDILPAEGCSELFDATVGGAGVREATQFCIKQIIDEDKDLEGGTAGAPLQVYNGDSVACTQTVLGVFSSSEGQVHLTTRVAPYISWIEGIVWPTVPLTSQRKHFQSFIKSIFKK